MCQTGKCRYEDNIGDCTVGLNIPNDAECVKRDADIEIYQALRETKFAQCEPVSSTESRLIALGVSPDPNEGKIFIQSRMVYNDVDISEWNFFKVRTYHRGNIISSKEEFEKHLSPSLGGSKLVEKGFEKVGIFEFDGYPSRQFRFLRKKGNGYEVLYAHNRKHAYAHREPYINTYG